MEISDKTKLVLYAGSSFIESKNRRIDPRIFDPSKNQSLVMISVELAEQFRLFDLSMDSRALRPDFFIIDIDGIPAAVTPSEGAAFKDADYLRQGVDYTTTPFTVHKTDGFSLICSRVAA